MRRVLLALLLALLAVAVLPPLGARLFGWARNEAALPPRGTSVALGDGLDVNVRDVGSGPPVVLVHGLPSNATDWAELPQKLAALGHRVIAYDRVGFGYSSHPPPDADNYTYASNARELAALLDRLAIPRAALVGWSYGGAVIQTLAQRSPERASHLVLIGAVGPALPTAPASPLDHLLNSPLGLPILTWVASIPPLGRAMTHDTLRAAFNDAQAIPPGWAAYTGAMLQIPGTLRSFVTEAQRDDPPSLKPETLDIPALVIHGGEDHLVPLAVGTDLHHRLRGSELVVVPGGSHMLPVTHPDLLAGLIHSFLASN